LSRQSTAANLIAIGWASVLASRNSVDRSAREDARPTRLIRCHDTFSESAFSIIFAESGLAGIFQVVNLLRNEQET
jgi:hypothetical protein